MATGTVSWFSTAKGYGWLETEEIADSIFVHAADLSREFGERGQRSANVGDKVEFNLEEQERGFRARLVVKAV